MPIFLADIHLTRARLFRDRAELAKARELLLDLRARGYHRHDQMLADAEAAAKAWPEPHDDPPGIPMGQPDDLPIAYHRLGEHRNQ